MEFQLGEDLKGCWVRWDETDAKYYYECNNDDAYKIAERKVIAHAAAMGYMTSAKFVELTQNL